MTETTKNNLGKKLARYGALTLAIAGVADATGQVNYTDVEPDFVGGAGDTFAIDFNNDGDDDITVIQSNNGNYELVKATPDGSNGVVAASNSGYFYASNLAYGTDIDGGTGSFRSNGSFCAGVGYTGSQFCGDGEGYIGVQFEAAGNTHYGWVRVDVADSSNFIVLDYAFDATPEAAIAAGDSTLGTDDSQFTGFVQFVSDNQLNLISNSTIMNSVVVYDISGKQVITQDLSVTNAQVNLAGLNTGVYIARVTIDGAEKTFKFVK
jgi:hypothetical protein